MVQDTDLLFTQALEMLRAEPIRPIPKYKVDSINVVSINLVRMSDDTYKDENDFLFQLQLTLQDQVLYDIGRYEPPS